MKSLDRMMIGCEPPAEGLSRYEVVTTGAARALGTILRRLLVATRPGSAAEAGYGLAGFDVDQLRRHR